MQHTQVHYLDNHMYIVQLSYFVFWYSHLCAPLEIKLWLPSTNVYCTETKTKNYDSILYNEFILLFLRGPSVNYVQHPSKHITVDLWLITDRDVRLPGSKFHSPLCINEPKDCSSPNLKGKRYIGTLKSPSVSDVPLYFQVTHSE